jgi:hypothetical protein
MPPSPTARARMSASIQCRQAAPCACPSAQPPPHRCPAAISHAPSHAEITRTTMPLRLRRSTPKYRISAERPADRPMRPSMVCRMASSRAWPRANGPPGRRASVGQMSPRTRRGERRRVIRDRARPRASRVALVAAVAALVTSDVASESASRYWAAHAMLSSSAGARGTAPADAQRGHSPESPFQRSAVG